MINVLKNTPTGSLIIMVVLVVLCSACSFDTKKSSAGQDSAPIYVPVNVMAVPDAIPKYEKRTRAGNPVEYEVLGKNYKVLSQSKGYQQSGLASWYGTKFHGRKTANGEIYNMYAMTAAHKTLPIPSYVQVTNLANNRRVVVRVNDRGPFHGKRIIDLSYTAAVKLGIQKKGVGLVEVIALDFDPLKRPLKKPSQKGFKDRVPEFFIQIGSFASLDKAEKLQQRLLSEPLFQAKIVPVQNQSGFLYKVRLGPYYSTDQSNAVSEKLWNIGITDIMLIQILNQEKSVENIGSIP